MSKRGSNSELFAHENDALTARPQHSQFFSLFGALLCLLPYLGMSLIHYFWLKYQFIQNFDFIFEFPVQNTIRIQNFSSFREFLIFAKFGYWAFLNMVIKRVPHPKKKYTPAHFDVHMILYQKIYRNLVSNRTTTGLPLLTLLICYKM